MEKVLTAEETLRVACGRVQDDIRTTAGVTWSYAIDGPGEYGQYFTVRPDGTRVEAYPEDDLETVTVEAADCQSDAVTETLVELGDLDFARTWPRCPAHDHSLDPALLNGRAVWRCRDDARIAAPIGQLTTLVPGAGR